MTKKKGLGKGLAALIGEAEDPNLSKSELGNILHARSAISRNFRSNSPTIHNIGIRIFPRKGSRNF